MGKQKIDAFQTSLPNSSLELAVTASTVSKGLNSQAQQIEARTAASLGGLEEIYKIHGPKSVLTRFEDIKFLMELAGALKEDAESLALLAATVPGKEGCITYHVSSRFLHQCLLNLIKDAKGKEKLIFVTGPEVNASIVIDQVVNFPMEYQTVAGACGEFRYTHQKLIELDEWGHALYGVFHTHPGAGPSATFPSSIDRDTQSKLERGGYRSIGGIFTRDGYVRFFSVGLRFRIHVYGKGVEEIEDRLYRLKKPEKI